MPYSVIGRDLAVDLGTANTLVHVRGRGVLLDEPSVVALSTTTDEVLAVGHEAKAMTGRTPAGIRVVRPLRDGVISDFAATERMLRAFIAQVHRRRYFTKPRLVVCVPSGISAVEQRAVVEAGYLAGARHVAVVEEPMAAAIGAGLPVHESAGTMVVDIGGGTTEVAVISMGAVVTSLSVRSAGDALDRALVAWTSEHRSLLMGERTAEQVKIAVGSAYPLAEELEIEVRGRDVVSGLPREDVLTSGEVRRALSATVEEIVGAVRAVLDRTPPELAGDVLDQGVVLTGGGALLRGLDEVLRSDLGVPVHVPADPLTSVVRGAGICLDELDPLHSASGVAASPVRSA